jgi:hypothetical protein
VSTHTRRTTDSTATDYRPTPTTGEAADDPDVSESWVKRCQRQFASDRTDRLNNLADDENHAMHDGV